ncbi:glycoprotein endo-alpha-1,2-mannosidase isoform X1 [Schistocerca gregaria]|uniref:glycoprotein endo-alpha-1,2-mannosidase isoform X1 n=2 Tax=Schistocerca gregaria TaxID=7010 RepID=UPI00211F3595|nr:glycoprotein endo-alpha-1,2-mannosidase isoform X1 [Schistocerca gregaria]XP_049846520.1 glycoprotein endo-alpha-1,2-mannosidase isoform X1 [Schistocerca gregaria]XP_049846521.1 glycoprotein endo-alpha-1,2-mannosidase isoform X1 [Schistocerca gregaria]XP_049846522.1 glycoprotein endo-alpha-1,2-mannosidase isoform X1 [Schistocerca gregaria]XP_049846523.1 glycoprotein endo-alpha-1,2-mannosidase isoform X1 [Schistocerca gregaria]XP_049846524.1 glycoprotein endo-alpha-1,2-mannosidase isoform X1
MCMVMHIRLLIIRVKRHVFLTIFMFSLVVVLGFISHKWRNMILNLDLPNRRQATIVQPFVIKTDLLTEENVQKLLSSKSYHLTTEKILNEKIAKAKRFYQKMQHISQKMKKYRSNSNTEQNRTVSTKLNYDVHIFYYVWYGNLVVDHEWKHWNHRYLPNWKKEDKRVYPTGSHHPPTDISSNFYPALGCYSSRDNNIIDVHMRLLRDANIGVLVISWYPPGMSDTEGASSDSLVSVLLDIANKYDLKIALHIEPYSGRNPINLAKYLQYIATQYASHPAFYHRRHRGKKLPVFYIYDSYLTPSGTWKELLSSKGNLSVRGTKLDGIFLGLLVDVQHRYEIKKAHFDGFYTYFASSGFTYGSSWKNWRSLSKFAYQNSLIFVPSVGPGYIDTQIRPWNVANIRHRRHGKYYEVAWRSAITTQPKIISITSFNEWHEGTQIEPALPKSTPSFTYLDYEPEGPYFYLNLTKWWINEFTKRTQDDSTRI